MKRVANPAYCQVKDCHQKYTISCQYFNRGTPGEIIENGTIVELGSDEVAWILSFLPLKRIMCLRRVNMTWREAATKTIVPTTTTGFRVKSVADYNATRVMTEALPNLQQIKICYPGEGYKYNDGEDPDEDRAAATADYTSNDIEIISNFSKLRVLGMYGGLNGRYPFLFSSFPLLQILSITGCSYLHWDLEMLAGLPSLKELDCTSNPRLTGSINSLRVLKDTLETVDLQFCDNVEGNFMDLADFPRLKVLLLDDTAVIGDIRDIGDKIDFLSLEKLNLPNTVYGGIGCKLQRVSDAPDLARALYRFRRQLDEWHFELSEDSPDWYESMDRYTPPFYIYFVDVVSRFGYRWTTKLWGSDDCGPCEVNWLDPEPDRESSDHKEYIQELQFINSEDAVKLYRGFHQPPTEEEYDRLLYEHYGGIRFVPS
jgi:hypothetical protein